MTIKVSRKGLGIHPKCWTFDMDRQVVSSRSNRQIAAIERERRKRALREFAKQDAANKAMAKHVADHRRLAKKPTKAESLAANIRAHHALLIRVMAKYVGQLHAIKEEGVAALMASMPKRSRATKAKRR